jgi:hypothetical protein
VAHAYNPSYSEGRDQEDGGSKPAWAKTLYRKNPSQKRAGGMVQGVGPEFKPQYHKKKSSLRNIYIFIHTYTYPL